MQILVQKKSSHFFGKFSKDVNVGQVPENSAQDTDYINMQTVVLAFYNFTEQLHTVQRTKTN